MPPARQTTTQLVRITQQRNEINIILWLFNLLLPRCRLPELAPSAAAAAGLNKCNKCNSNSAKAHQRLASWERRHHCCHLQLPAFIVYNFPFVLIFLAVRNICIFHLIERPSLWVMLPLISALAPRPKPHLTASSVAPCHLFNIQR